MRADAVTEVAVPSDDAGDAIDVEEFHVRLRAAIAALDEPYRAVVAGHLLNVEPLHVLAARLGRHPGTVRTQFQRGLREVRRRLPPPMLGGVIAVLAAHGNAATPLRLAWPRRATAAAVAMTALGAALWWSTGTPSAVSYASASEAAAAMPPDHEIGQVVTDAPPPSPPLRTVADATTTHVVRVQLHKQDGTPIEGLAVLLDPSFREGSVASRARARWRVGVTDAAGEVRFDGVPPGRAALRVDDLAPLRTFVVPTSPLRVEVRPRLYLEATLLDDAGEPIAGGTIHATGYEGKGRAGFPAGFTGADGRVCVPLTVQPCSVWATAPGFAATEVHGPFGTSGDSNRRSLTLRLATRSLPRVVVARDDAGTPLAAAAVAAWSVTPGSGPVHRLTDASGRCDIDGLPAGPWFAAVVADGFAPCTARFDGEVEVHLRPGRGGRLLGRVRGAGPLESARIDIRTRMIDSPPGNPFAMAGALLAADGTFETRLAPGAHQVGLFEGTTAPTATRLVAIGEGKDVRVEFDLVEAAGWRIQVVDEANSPLPGCSVLVGGDIGPERGILQRETADATGWVTLRRPCDFVHVAVQLPRGSGVNSLPTAVIERVAPGSLHSIVVTSDAQNVGQLRGVLHPALVGGGNRQVEICRAGHHRTLRVAGDGVIAATDLPPGEYRLALRPDISIQYRVVLATFVVTPGATVDLGSVSTPFGEAHLEMCADGPSTPLQFVLRDASATVVECGELAPGQIAPRLLPIGTYSLTFADAAASPALHTFSVTANDPIAVVLQHRAGVPCQIVVRSQPGSSYLGPLWLDIRPEGSDSGVPIRLDLAVDLRSWRSTVELSAGCYRVNGRLQYGERVEGSFVVPANGAPVDVAFDLR